MSKIDIDKLVSGLLKRCLESHYNEMLALFIEQALAEQNLVYVNGDDIADIPLSPDQRVTLQTAREVSRITFNAEDGIKTDIRPQEKAEDQTPFEKRLCEIIDCAMRNPVDNPNTIIYDVKKKIAPELFAIAYKQFEPELERAYKNADEVQYKHGYEKGKEEAMKAQYHDFRDGERSAARNVLEMINNGWGIGCIKALCEEKLNDED